jgi:hypothetical protein
LPIIINPRLIGTDSTAEVRNIQKGSIYVYDIKEDRNYKIIEVRTPIFPSCSFVIVCQSSEYVTFFCHFPAKKLKWLKFRRMRKSL